MLQAVAFAASPFKIAFVPADFRLKSANGLQGDNADPGDGQGGEMAKAGVVMAGHHWGANSIAVA